MKKFFQKLFMTKAYMDSLTAKDVVIAVLTKAEIYEYAYNLGRIEQLLGTGPDRVTL